MSRVCQASSVNLSKAYGCHCSRFFKLASQANLSSLTRVYLFWLCYLYLTALCLAKCLSMDILFRACYADIYTHLYRLICYYAKRTTYSFCISSWRNVLKWRDNVWIIIDWYIPHWSLHLNLLHIENIVSLLPARSAGLPASSTLFFQHVCM